MKHIASTIVRTPDIALNNNLFGGTLLRWLDEYGALYVYENLNHTFVTSWIGETYFTKTAQVGDLIKFYRKDLEFHRSYVQFRLVGVVKGDQPREIINTAMKFVPIDKQTGRVVRMNPFLFEREEFELFAKQKIGADVSQFEITGKYGDPTTYKHRFIAGLYKYVHDDTSTAIAAFQADYGRITPASTVTLIINRMADNI